MLGRKTMRFRDRLAAIEAENHAYDLECRDLAGLIWAEGGVMTAMDAARLAMSEVWPGVRRDAVRGRVMRMHGKEWDGVYVTVREDKELGQYVIEVCNLAELL